MPESIASEAAPRAGLTTMYPKEKEIKKKEEVNYSVVNRDYLADKHYSFLDYKKNSAQPPQTTKKENEVYTDIVMLDHKTKIKNRFVLTQSNWNQNLRKKPNVLDHSIHFKGSGVSSVSGEKKVPLKKASSSPKRKTKVSEFQPYKESSKTVM